MMKNKMKTTEMQDFEILYKNIENEVIRERIRTTGQWYIEHAIRYKYYFYTLSIVGIVLPLLISSVNVLGCDYKNLIRIVTTIASAIVSLSTGILTFMKCGEKWTLYRSTIEMMKRELTLYWVNATDEKALENLIYKLEKIMDKEHNKWEKIQQKDENEIMEKRINSKSDAAKEK